jgi:hypothetical protein
VYILYVYTLYYTLTIDRIMEVLDKAKGPLGPCYGLEKNFSGASPLGEALAPWTNVGR